MKKETGLITDDRVTIVELKLEASLQLFENKHGVLELDLSIGLSKVEDRSNKF